MLKEKMFVSSYDLAGSNMTSNVKKKKKKEYKFSVFLTFDRWDTL